MSTFRSFYDSRPSQNVYKMHFGKIQGVGKVSTLLLLWISKRALKLLIDNPVNLLQSLYDHPFYINLLCPQGITYNPCSEGCRGVVILKCIIARLFNYVQQKGYFKTFIGCVWGNGGRGKGG